jgi:hypothetical protein
LKPFEAAVGRERTWRQTDQLSEQTNMPTIFAHLRSIVLNSNLEIAVRILLILQTLDGFLDIDKELASD